MKQSELDKLNIEKSEGIFTPNYSYAECLTIKNEDGEVIDCEYVDFILHKTAEEVYQQWLVDKDKLLTIVPTVEERIKSTEDTLLILLDMQMGGI